VVGPNKSLLASILGYGCAENRVTHFTPRQTPISAVSRLVIRSRLHSRPRTWFQRLTIIIVHLVWSIVDHCHQLHQKHVLVVHSKLMHHHFHHITWSGHVGHDDGDWMTTTSRFVYQWRHIHIQRALFIQNAIYFYGSVRHTSYYSLDQIFPRYTTMEFKK